MSWLKKYFGKVYDVLQPEVIKEGKFKAIVRLTNKNQEKDGHSAVGYILVRKGGSHESSNYIVLHNGLAHAEHLKTMERVLEQEDGK